MGKAWAEASPAARETFEEADEALGFPLSRLCWEGPEEELNLTANTQPALVAAATAVHRALAVLAPELVPVAMAGHSLGEYSALVAAGALGFADALRLVRRRGELMQEAVPVGKGAMAAIIGLDAEYDRRRSPPRRPREGRGLRGGQPERPGADGDRRPQGGGRPRRRRSPRSGAPARRRCSPSPRPSIRR